MRGIGEADGLARGHPTWRRAVAQPKTRGHLPLGLKAGEPDGRSTSLAAPRRREVLERLGRVHRSTLEDVARQFMAPGEAPRPVIVDQRVIRPPVLPGVEFVDEGERCPGERRS